MRYLTVWVIWEISENHWCDNAPCVCVCVCKVSSEVCEGSVAGVVSWAVYVRLLSGLIGVLCGAHSHTNTEGEQS